MFKMTCLVLFGLMLLGVWGVKQATDPWEGVAMLQVEPDPAKGPGAERITLTTMDEAGNLVILRGQDGQTCDNTPNERRCRWDMVPVIRRYISGRVIRSHLSIMLEKNGRLAPRNYRKVTATMGTENVKIETGSTTEDGTYKVFIKMSS